MQGGMTVVGLVTGGHFLEDIQVSVPHKVSVLLSPEQMHHSKDLYRALGQGCIMQLTNGPQMWTTQPSTASDQRIQELEREKAALERELKLLRQRLLETETANTGLLQVLQGLGSQLNGIQASMGRLEEKATVVQVREVQVREGASPVQNAMVDDTPVFIPDQILPEGVTAQIQAETQVSGGVSLDEASSRLRNLRRRNQGP